MRKKETASASAFTLIELLVTVVILSTGIVLILQAFQTSMVALAESRDTMRAAALSHALVVQGEMDARSGSGVIDDHILQSRYPDYWWRVDTRSDSDAACTNASWLKHEVVVMVQHDVTGREVEAVSWVQVESEKEERSDP
ncbi:MAG: type II secretion system protein [Kiritimatiellae bacterium]|nr:type II secretion system protein [Kiritimatiellia bacterium]